MNTILSYSGIVTKTRAMRGRLIKPDQYAKLIGCPTLADAVAFLKELPSYSECLSDFNAETSHRGSIESELTSSLYADFNRLMLFADPKQEQFLMLYLLHFEVRFLKDCLHSAYAGTTSLTVPAYFKDFFARRSGLRFDDLIEATSIEDFLELLQNTRFYATLKRVYDSPFNSLFDYQTALDQNYFVSVWKAKDKIFSGKEQKILAESYGQRIDLLNLQWIMRARKYYQMSEAEIISMVIPCHYHLRNAEIIRMAQTADYTELLSVIKTTWYGRRMDDGLQIQSVEATYTEIVSHILASAARRHPYTFAPINAYLYDKEHEISRVTSILEGIRYEIPRHELMAFYVDNKKSGGDKH